MPPPLSSRSTQAAAMQPPLSSRSTRAAAMQPPLSPRFRGRRNNRFRSRYRHSGCHGQYITTPCCEVSSCT